MPDLIPIYGQSNSLFLSSVDGSPPAALAGTRWFNGSVYGAVPASEGLRALLNTYKTLTGQDCDALDGGVSGQTISGLVKGTGNYTAFMAQITAAAAVPRFIVWHQGEQDAGLATATSAAQWLASLAQLHSDICADSGTTTSACPLILSGLGTTTAGNSANNRTWSQQQQSIILAGDLPNIFYGFSNMDATLQGDGIHYDGPHHRKMGARYGYALASVRGDVSGFPFVKIAYATKISDTVTRVYLTHSLGTDFTPTIGIAGFEVNIAGAWASATAARAGARIIDLTHAAAPDWREVGYQRGKTPTISGLVLDNSTYAAPLRPTGNPVPVDTRPFAEWLNSTNGTDASSTTTMTLKSRAAYATRRIVVFVQLGKANTVVSATIGGVAATVHKTQAASVISVSCISAIVPTGTDISVAVTFSGISNACAITAWEFDDSTGQLIDVQSSITPTATVGSVTLNVPDGGSILSSSLSSNTTSNAGVVTSSGIDVFSRREIAQSGVGQVVQADATCLSANAARTLTATYTQSGTVAVIAASFGPKVTAGKRRFTLNF